MEFREKRGKKMAVSNLTSYQIYALQKLLSDNHINYSEFASKVGISPVTVSRWVNGKTRISEYSARKINEAFPDYSIDYILGYAIDPEWADVECQEPDKHQLARVQGEQLLTIIAISSHPYRVIASSALMRGDKPVEIVNRATGEKLFLSPEQWEIFVVEISEYIGLRLGQMFKWGVSND